MEVKRTSKDLLGWDYVCKLFELGSDCLPFGVKMFAKIIRYERFQKVLQEVNLAKFLNEKSHHTAIRRREGGKAPLRLDALLKNQKLCTKQRSLPTPDLTLRFRGEVPTRIWEDSCKAFQVGLKKLILNINFYKNINFNFANINYNFFALD